MSRTLNYWSCYSIATSELNGYATLSIPIPGTYTGLTPVDSGRTIIKSLIAFANPTMGDRITSITVTDTNGVIPVDDRVLFPAYPLIGTYGDPGVAPGNKVMFLAPSTEGWSDFVPATAGGIFIPSQLNINITFAKASVSVDTAYVNLQWQNLIIQ